MEKLHEYLENAIKHIQIADHMTYVTFPLVNEKRLLIKIFEEIYQALIYLIKQTLANKNEQITNTEEDIKKFFIIIKNFSLNENQIQKIKEIILINQKHKTSPLEFVKKEKIVILSDSLNIEILDIQLIKQYLLVTKEIFLKIMNN